MSKKCRIEKKTRAPRWTALALTTLGFLMAQSTAHAAGFGPLRVQSNLGQPLQAEIEITGVTADEAAGLAVKLASPDAYRGAGLTYNPVVSNLQVQLDRRSPGNYVARVRSSQPVNEPFVDILVDMSWASGRVLRAYTFLLDPVGSASPARAESSQASATVMQPTLPAPARPAAERVPTPVARPSQAPAPSAAAPVRSAGTTNGAVAPGSAYTVRRRDSLYSIAADAAHTQSAVSLVQMLLALYRNNPGAFIGGNINRLKSGAVLKIPQGAEANSVSSAAARREVIAHTQGFDSYRERLATAAASQKAEAGDTRQRSGSVTARVQDQGVPAQATRDELKLSRAERGSAANLAAVNEELIAKDRALKDAQERLAQLEKNLADLQRLVALKSGEQLAPAAAAAATAGGAAAAASAPLAVAGVAAPATAESQPASTESGAAAVVASDAIPATPTVAAPVAVAPASAPAAATPAVPAPVLATATSEGGFLSTLTSSPTLLPGVAALLALLGSFVWLRRRSSEKSGAAHNGFQDSLLSQENTVMGGANSLFGAPGGQSVDTTQHSVFGADFRIGTGAADANEVDPVAEADVYIAYGRDVQAEEILREALEHQPERQAVRLKLLEIFSNRQDVTEFNAQAEEMHAQTGGAGADWAQAADMGRRLDPGNPLYAAAVASADGALAFPDSEPVSEADTKPAEDLWMTRENSSGVDAPTQGPIDMGELALPLDSFPAPEEQDETLMAMHLDVSDLEDDAAPASAAGPDTRPLELDLSGISLDLNGPAKSSGANRAESASPSDEMPPLTMPMHSADGGAGGHDTLATLAIADDTLSPSTLPEDGDGSRDLQIKLDLARAYIEIGDKDGARELLEEVLVQADDSLRAETETMLAQLR